MSSSGGGKSGGSPSGPQRQWNWQSQDTGQGVQWIDTISGEKLPIGVVPTGYHNPPPKGFWQPRSTPSQQTPVSMQSAVLAHQSQAPQRGQGDPQVMNLARLLHRPQQGQAGGY